MGYAFYAHKDQVMHVHDLFFLPEDDVPQALVTHMTAAGFAQKAQAISVTLFESNPLIHVLQRYNYVLRPETSSVIVHASPGMLHGALLQDKTNWFMTVGDRDV